MGVASSHPWLRRFNPSKPHKFFIELIGAADLKSGIPFEVFVNEGNRRKVNGRVSVVSILYGLLINFFRKLNIILQLLVKMF